MKKIIALCFLLPFIFSALSIQAFMTKFVSVAIGQFIAYFNVFSIFLGIILFVKFYKVKRYPNTIKLWLIFFASYYAIGLIANITNNTEVPFLKTIIPVIYFIGFSMFLSSSDFRKRFSKIVLVVFTLCNIILIYFHRINFSMDQEGIVKLGLERAGGVYGDGNNAAVVCLLAFIFLVNFYRPVGNFHKILKIASIAISLYALVLTFSKTGFLVLIFVLILTFHHLLNPKRILFFIILLPLSLYFLVQSALSSDSLSRVQKNRIESVANILTLKTDKVSLSGRDKLFQNMMEYIYQNPILGNGIYFSTDIRGHNTIFGVWADAGILCFLLFLLLLYQYFRNAVRSPVHIRYGALSILFVLTLFMLTLQTIINQPYLIVLFAYLSYEMDNKTVSKRPLEEEAQEIVRLDTTGRPN